MHTMQQRLYYIRTIDERKTYDKQYKASHQAEIKQYREANRDQATKRAKQWRIDNERDKHYKQEYNDTNNARLQERSQQPWKCTICNSTCQLYGKARHIKTQQHQDNLNPKPQDNLRHLELSNGTIVTGTKHMSTDGRVTFKTNDYYSLTTDNMIEIVTGGEFTSIYT